MLQPATCGYLFPHGGGGCPMVDISTQCSEQSPSYPDITRHSVVCGCIEHQLGSTVECIDGVQCMDNNRENTQRTHIRSHTQSLLRRTKRLLLMCQDNQIVLRARHIPRRLNVLAEILSRIERSCRHPVAPCPDVRYRMVSRPMYILSTDTGMGNPLTGSVYNKVETQLPLFVSAFQIHQPCE